jgi:hypothetical protein
MSNDEALRRWKHIMKRFNFLLGHEQCIADSEGNLPDWYNEWQDDLNAELAVMEKDYPHLLELAALEDFSD